MKKIIITLFTIFALFGCASIPKHMTITTNLNIQHDDKNAKIIFYRPSNSVGAGRFIEISEIRNNNIDYLGYISDGSGIIHSAKPGKHIFSIFNGVPDSIRWMILFNQDISSSFEIDVEAGKYYYVEVKTFLPSNVIPINQSNIDKLDKLNSIKWTYPNEHAKKILEKNADKYYKSWLTAVEKKRIYYMKKEDGINQWLGIKNTGSTLK